MARSSFLEDLFEIARRLPWWAGIGLALALYVFVPVMVSNFIPTNDDPVFNAVTHGGEIFFTVVLRYIIPIAFVLGAIASVIEKSFSSSLLHKTRVNSSLTAEPFAEITWRQFEKLTAAYFREQGYYVFETQEGADGGVDLKMLKGSDVFLVQCKHWKARKVPVQLVRELFGVMAAKQAAGAYVVASGEFTQDAKRFADGKNIELISGSVILGQAAKQIPEPPVNDTPISSTPETSIFCPACNSSMVIRTARKGINAGRQFYGCTQYPACRAVVNFSVSPGKGSKWGQV